MQAACGLSAAVSLRAEPNMWEDVCWRLCLSRWVPTLTPSLIFQSLSLFTLFFPQSPAPVSVLRGTVRKMTYVKVLQSRPGPVSSCVSLCVHACVWWWSRATLSTHVLNQGYRVRLAHFGIELFSRSLALTQARCAADQWLFEFWHRQTLKYQ